MSGEGARGGATRPPSDFNTSVTPTWEIRRKLEEFKVLDFQCDSEDMRKMIEEDEDVRAWWVYHVFRSCQFEGVKWKFIYEPSFFIWLGRTDSILWLTHSFIEAAGHWRYQDLKVEIGLVDEYDPEGFEEMYVEMYLS